MRKHNPAPNVARFLLPIAMSGMLCVSLSACDMLQKLPFLNQTPQAESPSVKADPKVIKAHLDKGNALAKQGKWEEAEAEFAQVLALDPGHVQAHVQSGWANAELKRWDEAQRHLLSALSSDPNNAAAHANLAWVYAEKKHWQDAQQAAKRAIDLDPKNPYPHATLAWAYQETKQDDLALAEYEKSIELNPGLDNSHFAAGILSCNKGLINQAKKHHSHLLKLKSPKAAELQARISKGCGTGK
ncbi:MAG TPA: tetratricopeptide repeat protein [Oculatellaceae cyanobacterium]|jgi:tetratricopeptide (TPR) repeat protein